MGDMQNRTRHVAATSGYTILCYAILYYTIVYYVMRTVAQFWILVTNAYLSIRLPEGGLFTGPKAKGRLALPFWLSEVEVRRSAKTAGPQSSDGH